KLPERFRVPIGGDALGVERRELALELAGDDEVEVRRLAGGAMAQDRARLARVVVAVVAEIHDAAADLGLQRPRGPDLGHEEAPREEAAGLLAERDDRPIHWARPPARRCGRIACRVTLSTMHAAQPMMLYQR